MKVAFVSEPLHDRVNQRALHDRAEKSERREEISGLRRVEAEPPRHEERERRLKYRERKPVDEIHQQDPAEIGPPHHRAQTAERHPRAGVRAADGLGQSHPRHHRRHQRQPRRRPNRRRVTHRGEDSANRRPEDEAEAERGSNQPVGTGAIFGSVTSAT